MICRSFAPAIEAGLFAMDRFCCGSSLSSLSSSSSLMSSSLTSLMLLLLLATPPSVHPSSSPRAALPVGASSTLLHKSWSRPASDTSEYSMSDSARDSSSGCTFFSFEMPATVAAGKPMGVGGCISGTRGNDKSNGEEDDDELEDELLHESSSSTMSSKAATVPAPPRASMSVSLIHGLSLPFCRNGLLLSLVLGGVFVGGCLLYHQLPRCPNRQRPLP